MTAARFDSPASTARPWAVRPVRVGISACLLGEAVRFDGGHKRDPFLTTMLGRFVEWVPVCPEVECGLGTPRESMRLVRRENGVRLLTVKTGRDVTDAMQAFADERVARLAGQDLSGYVLKKDSPSCGLERVRIYDPHGVPSRSGRGLFAERLRDALPHLPIEEEGRLSDPRLRENFVERVFAYSRLRTLFRRRWTVGDLVRFHTASKLLLMSHSPSAYQELGRLVGGARRLQREALERRYTSGFMGALEAIATPGRHANVMHHMAGYFKDRLDGESKRELLGAIAEYHQSQVPLVVPMTLLRHHVRVHAVAYLAGQLYLDPHPGELGLRNHV
jgi:uncharacterized protein YbgA (DUF1722 family)/uncharacterized protein YbbK (DUF523 family)